MNLSAHGITVAVPRGWDARIFRREESVVAAPHALDDPVPQSGITTPVLHLANFALPDNRGDYGSGAVDRMRADHVFLAMVEFGPESVGTPLFAASGMPRLRTAEISPSSMQRPMAPLAGAQRFFTVAGRPFCCYAVVGSATRRSSLVRVLNEGLAAVSVAPA